MLIRATLVASLAALAASVFAQTPQFSCPIRLELLTEIDGAGVGGLDRIIYGVRARDWKPEFLDQALRRYEACQAAAPGPQSLKDAERADALRQFQLFKGSLQQRDQLVAQEARQASAQIAVAQSGAAQIGQRDGALTWAYVQRRAGSASDESPFTITCAEPNQLPRDLLTLSPQSQLELPKFYAACVQAQQLVSGPSATLFKESIDELARERQAQAGFLAGVRTLVAAPPQQQTHQSVSALENANRFHSSSEPAVNAAAKQLATLRQQVDARECSAHGKQAGIPEDLLKAQYLIEWATPAPLVGMACVAARNGVPFRFSAKSLLSKDSFEVRGTPSVKVVLGRQDTAEGIALLVPQEGTVQGKSDVVRHETGCDLLIRKSKTDQRGEGQMVFVPMAKSKDRCPVLALNAWLEMAEITGGPLFRQVSRHDYLVGDRGLTPQAVAQIVQAAVKAARGPDAAAECAAHSLRAGFVTEAAASGVPVSEIMGVTRHTSVATLYVYIRPIEKRRVRSLL